MNKTLEAPILLQPYLTRRPWGGDRLRLLGKEIPAAPGPYGESWELSDHPDGISLVAAPLEDQRVSFGAAIRKFPRELLGRETPPETYPLLVKYIDAESDLSVQVHPDDDWCRTNNHPDRGKSECWYVLDCAPDARIVFGFKEGTTEGMARKALSDGTLAEILEYIPIRPGDFVAVPARSVHAIMGGTLICEIQQASNTTFRLFDWNRLPRRELHIEQSMQVSEFDRGALPPIQRLGPTSAKSMAAPKLLLSNEFFTVEYLDIPPHSTLENLPLQGAPGTILNIVSGEATLAGIRWSTGQTWYLPASLRSLSRVEAGESGVRLLFSRSKEI